MKLERVGVRSRKERLRQPAVQGREEADCQRADESDSECESHASEEAFQRAHGSKKDFDFRRAGAYIITLISTNTIEMIITAATSWKAGDSEVIALVRAVFSEL